MDRSRLSRFVDQPLADLPFEAPVSVSATDTVRHAVSLMREGSQSCVLLMEGARLAGIFTERDVLTRCTVDGFDWDQPIANVVTPNPRAISAEGRVADAIATLQQHSYRTLPIVDGERVAGLIRLGDLLTDLAEAFPEDVLNLPPRPHQVMEKQEGG